MGWGLTGIWIGLCGEIVIRAGLFAWEEFRERLIGELAAWERESRPAAHWSYYERWQAAFEALLAAKGLLARPELDARLPGGRSAAPAGDHVF